VRNINSFAYFLAVSGALFGVALNASFASDLNDLETSREKAINDYMSAIVTQRANTPAAQAALRHQIVDPVTAAYKDFFAHKLGSGPRGPAALIKPTAGVRQLSSNGSASSSQSFQGISASSPTGNGESKPAPHENFVLDGSKIPKELSFGKDQNAAAVKKATDAGSKNSSNTSGRSPAGGNTAAGPVVAPGTIKQFKDTTDLLKLDKFSAPIQSK
jgi:hypothetical protein